MASKQLCNCVSNYEPEVEETERNCNCSCKIQYDNHLNICHSEELEMPRKYSRDDLLSLRTNDISKNLPDCVNDPRLNSLRFWKNVAYQQNELDAANFFYGDRFSDSRNISSLHLMPAFVKRQIIGGINTWTRDDTKYRSRKDTDNFLQSTIQKKPAKLTRTITPPFVPPPPPIKRCTCLWKHPSSPAFDCRPSNHCSFHKSESYMGALALSPREVVSQPARLNPYIAQLPVEPEWITAGPVSQYETIELRGFDEFKDSRISIPNRDQILLNEAILSGGTQQNNISNKSRKNMLNRQSSPIKKIIPDTRIDAEYPVIWRNSSDYQFHDDGVSSDIPLQSNPWNNVFAATSQYSWSNVPFAKQSELDECNESNVKKFNPVTTPLRNTTNQLLLDFIQKNSIVAPCPDNSAKICNIPSVEDLEASMRRSGISQPSTIIRNAISVPQLDKKKFDKPDVGCGCEKKKTRVRFQTNI